MNNEEMVKPYMDVCIIGAGAGGPVVAKQLAQAGCSVVLLEAGKEFDLQTEFTDLPFDMIYRKFSWPLLRTMHPFVYDDEWNPMMPNEFGRAINAWGVGGTTLMYYGNHPRAHYVYLDRWNNYEELPGYVSGDLHSPNWRTELAPYYTALEHKLLPVPNAPMGYGPFDTKNAMALVGARFFDGLVTGDDDADLSEYLPYKNNNPYIPMFDPDQYDPYSIPFDQFDPGGFRGQPNNMTTNCWHCGNCVAGCHRPLEAQLKSKVKRATNASFVPGALDAGCDLRSQSLVAGILHSGVPDLPHLVIYGTYTFGLDGVPARFRYNEATQEWEQTSGLDPEGIVKVDHLYVQPAKVVVFSAGTIESPRLWKQSNALLNSPVFNNPNFPGPDENPGIVQSLLLSMAQQLGVPYEVLYPAYVKGNVETDFYTLTDPDDEVGRNFMSHLENFVVASFNKPIEQWIGQNSQTRIDVPGIGMIEPLFVSPGMLGNIAFGKGIRYVMDQTGDFVLDGSGNKIVDPGQHVLTPQGPVSDPFAPNYVYPVHKFGVGIKKMLLGYYEGNQKIGGYSNSCTMMTSVEDEEQKPYNKIFLDPEKTQSFYVPELEAFGQQPVLEVPAPAIQYVASDPGKENKRKMGKILIEVIKSLTSPNSELELLTDPATGKEAIYNLNMELDMAVHMMGTMSLGKVLNSDCEAKGSERIYVADASVLPNGLGGPNPVTTTQAMALRTSEAIFRKYFNTEDDPAWEKWKTKIGTGTFLY